MRGARSGSPAPPGIWISSACFYASLLLPLCAGERDWATARLDGRGAVERGRHATEEAEAEAETETGEGERAQAGAAPSARSTASTASTSDAAPAAVGVNGNEEEASAAGAGAAAGAAVAAASSACAAAADPLLVPVAASSRLCTRTVTDWERSAGLPPGAGRGLMVLAAMAPAGDADR